MLSVSKLLQSTRPFCWSILAVSWHFLCLLLVLNVNPVSIRLDFLHHSAIFFSTENAILWSLQRPNLFSLITIPMSFCSSCWLVTWSKRNHRELYHSSIHKRSIFTNSIGTMALLLFYGKGLLMVRADHASFKHLPGRRSHHSDAKFMPFWYV